MAIVTMRELLEAGIHFGHQTRRWNPKMQRYIFGERNGIYIIDLQQTMRQIRKAYSAVQDAVAAGGTVLFVGTKKQAREAVAREAQRCGMYYVNSRWLGGTLTNWTTIRESIKKLLDLEEVDRSGKIDQYSKKEAIQLRKACARLDKNLVGIKQMPGLPDVLFVVDAKKELIAVREAERLGMTCVAVVDTNCDPDLVTIPIPGNDDALRAVALFCKIIADAVMEGRMLGDEFEADDLRKHQGRGARSRPAREQEQQPQETLEKAAAAEELGADAEPEAIGTDEEGKEAEEHEE